MAAISFVIGQHLAMLLAPRAVLVSALLAASACGTGRQPWIPPDRRCPGALRPVWMANPNFTMCVSTSFRTHDLKTWERERPGRPPDRLNVQTGVSQLQVDLTGAWPPRLRPTGASTDRGPDSVETRIDTIAGAVARTEIGKRTMGPAGETMLGFASGIRTTEGGYVIASGQSVSAATLDTLVLMFRTLARSPSPDPNRR